MALAEGEVARYAWECVRNVPQDQLRAYRQVVRGAATIVRLSGLAPACALWRAADTSRRLYDQVDRWLVTRQKVYQRGGSGTELVNLVIGDVSKYPRAKREVLVLLSWLKLFAEARFAEQEAEGRRAQGGPEARR